MNPLLQAALASIARHFLTVAAGVLVSKGIWSTGDATSYVEAAALAIIALGWSAYQKYRVTLQLDKYGL